AVSLAEYGINPAEVTVDAKNPSSGTSRWVDIFLVSLLPIFLIMGFFYFMMRQAQGTNQQALGFGKSKARLSGDGKDEEKITFADVAGSEEAKEELQEIVEFLKFPKKFRDLGARIPKGVLMVGAPGTGKTLLARAIAGEAAVPFFSISASEFVEMFVGVGASRVRDLFMKAKKNSPCIIFIDEIDAVGRRRGSGLGGGHDEREQTLNQILVEMDGFEQGTNVIVLAATNRPDVLDPALLRPGRFDRQVILDLPDRKDRLAILKVHLKNKPLAEEVKLDNIAGKTAGMSGADLANITNEAAILAARRNHREITAAEMDEAFEKVAIGPERKSKVLTEQEKELTAYHESGHALVGHVLPNADPIHKVTIVARGQTGGITWSLPVEDRRYHSLLEFKDEMAMAMGGRAAEELVYGQEQVTTGASSDLRKATQIARDMIVKYGMSPSLPQFLDTGDDHTILLDRDFAATKIYSDATAEVIDSEVKSLIKEATERAKQIIKSNLKLLKKLAKELLKQETLEENEIKQVLKGARLPKLAVVPARSQQ
ncbi:ATP-dependent zinc metalloprotease FtsH, partial [Candidatus Microgenomates bacterium]|nr:ATP-dependent zinc metalloprotease FtsH [Candidatus Microgenomates bacterium]